MMSNDVRIELFPAGNGDACLIDTGQDLILIDGGFTSTFRDHLRPKLEVLHNQGRRISRLIVTHIDADHISGIIALLKANGKADNPQVIGIDEIWFNSYRHLHLKEKVSGTLEGDLPEFELGGGLESREVEDENVLVSHKQGSTLGSLILKNGYNWNSNFDGKAAVADDPHIVPPNGAMNITLLGPTQNALDDLADDWYKFLKKRFDGEINEDEFFDDAFELMMEEMRQNDLESSILPDQSGLVSASGDWVQEFKEDWEKEDKSPTNGSSIIFLIEANDRKLMFLGDAHPSKILSQLQKMGYGPDNPIEVDVLKVTHHGAWYNNSPDLIKSIKANHYLFSSNGKRHHHPHYQTLAWIVNSHGTEAKKQLVFNYRQADYLDSVYDFEMQEVYNYSTKGPDVDDFGQGQDGYVELVLGDD